MPLKILMIEIYEGMKEVYAKIKDELISKYLVLLRLLYI